jgi:hypothetical protein
MKNWIADRLARRRGPPVSGRPPLAEGPNARVWQAVDAFLSDAKSPRHALLIDGPWGVGKTHFYKAIELVFGAGKRWLYVSLYGVRDKRDIDRAVFAALYPSLSGKGAQVAGALAAAVLQRGGIDFKLDPATLMDRSAADVIVFDDLERAGLGATELLGYINTYVEHEHDGLKVILLANVAELVDVAGFQRTREKVIGRTLRLAPDFDAAFDAFIADLPSAGSGGVLRGGRERIRTLHKQSGTSNLRVLHQTVRDFARLADALEPHHRENLRAMRSLVDLVFVLAMEFHSAGIEATELDDRRNQWIRGVVAEGQPTAIRRLSEKYLDAGLIETPISDEALRDLLIDGVVDEQRVRSDLDRSRWFLTEEEVAWRVVWRAFELPDAMVEPAIDEMNRVWAEHGYVRAGEILHVLGLRLWLSDIDRIPMNRADVEADGRRYIDTVRDSGALEAVGADHIDRVMVLRSHGGLGYMERETDAFRRLADYLSEQRVVADDRRRPAQAAELFEELKASPDLFSRRILSNGGEDSRWSQIALLHHLDPAEFAHWLAEQDPAIQRETLTSLSVRYDFAALEQHLAEERPWLESLRDQLVRIAAESRPVARDRLTKNVAWYLAPVLDGRQAE